MLSPSFDLRTVASCVINLDRDTQRLETFQRKYNARGIYPQRQPAVYGTDLNLKQLMDEHVIDSSIVHHMKHGRTIHSQINTMGAIGCYLSHVNVWNRLLSDELHDMYMVFEDDCDTPTVPIEEINRYVNETIQLHPEWDLIYIGYLRDYGTTRHEEVGCNQLRIADSVFGAHAYLLNKKGARKCLAHAFPIVFHVDWFLSYQCSSGRVDAYRPTVAFIHQNQSETTIHWDHKNNTKLMMNYLPNQWLNIILVFFTICFVLTVVFAWKMILKMKK